MREKAKNFFMLIAQGGQQDGQRWVVRKSILIGRGDDCDIIIPSQQVSRHHARLEVTLKGIILEDLGSKNGTHCNGEKIVGPVTLHEEDTVQVALAQQYVLVSSDATVPLSPNIPLLEKTQAEHAGKQRLRLDKRSRRVWVNGDEIKLPLSLLQFNLLDVLYQTDEQVASREDIINAVWGQEDAAGVSEQALDALVRRLRDRLAEFDPQHDYIVTVRGHGFRMDNPFVD
jgi:pSer/pThr/pTyr-binding forkhead associated (FHA) protein